MQNVMQVLKEVFFNPFEKNRDQKKKKENRIVSRFLHTAHCIGNCMEAYGVWPASFKFMLKITFPTGSYI